jgi:hypothetical protein
MVERSGLNGPTENSPEISRAITNAAGQTVPVYKLSNGDEGFFNGKGEWLQKSQGNDYYTKQASPPSGYEYSNGRLTPTAKTAHPDNRSIATMGATEKPLFSNPVTNPNVVPSTVSGLADLDRKFHYSTTSPELTTSGRSPNSSSTLPTSIPTLNLNSKP